MLMALAEHARTLPGTCSLPVRPDPTLAGVDPGARAERLLVALAEGAEPSEVRGQAWLAAEALRSRGKDARPERATTLRGFDLLGAIWAACDRLDRGWRWLDMGAPSEAMRAAAAASERVDELEALAPGGAGQTAQLRGRVQALWHLADGLDEVAFLGDSGDREGARDRARQVLRQVEQLAQRGLLTLDEQDIVHAAASRWGARPQDTAGGSWAS
jgi:hypothetical protein